MDGDRQIDTETFIPQVLRYLDGVMTADEIQQFNDRLEADPAAREAFVQFCCQSRMVAETLRFGVFRSEDETRSAALPLGAAMDSPAPPLSFLGGRTLRLLVTVTALWAIFWTTLGMALVSWRKQSAQPQLAQARVVPAPVVARLTRSRQAQWSGNDGQRLFDGAFLRRGQRLELLTGIAEIKLDRGVTLLLQGPARLTLVEPLVAELSLGRLSARVSPRGHGFAVETPVARVVDLGTEFAAEVDALGNVEVQVFQGQVEVQQPGEARPQLLAAGQRMRVYPGGAPSQRDAAIDSSKFIRSLDSLPSGVAPPPPDVVLEAVQDTFVDAGSPTLESGPSPQMLVKLDNASPHYHREGWVQFDLSGLPRGQIRWARLQLVTTPGRGEDVSQRWDFEVYGLGKPSQATWREGELNWEATRRLSLTPLARFILEGPTPIGSRVQAAGSRLAEYLRTSSEDHVTLAIRRVTDGAALAHGFATRENPRYPGPRLEIWYGPSPHEADRRQQTLSDQALPEHASPKP